MNSTYHLLSLSVPFWSAASGDAVSLPIFLETVGFSLLMMTLSYARAVTHHCPSRRFSSLPHGRAL